VSKELIEYVVKSIVGEAPIIDIDKSSQDGVISFKVKVNREDRGRLIGREGRTIRSLKALVQNLKENAHRHCSIELID